MSNVANSNHSDPALHGEEMHLKTDVVEEHHRRNHFPRAPDPQQLHQVHPGHSSTSTSQATPLDEIYIQPHEEDPNQDIGE